MPGLKNVDAILRESEDELAVVFRKLDGASTVDILKSIRQALVRAFPDHKRSPLADALFRGIEAQHRIKEMEGGSISAQDAAKVLGLTSRKAVLERFKSHRLLGWREKQEVRFPIWQFSDRGEVLQGLPDVLNILDPESKKDDWYKVLFFLNPRESLNNKRPLDLLREGKLDRVKSLAGSYAE